MPDPIVIAVRQSPDWTALARDHLAGQAIDPARFLPPRHVPDFPPDIAALIGRWNALSRVDFFSCRARLKRIAQALLFRIPGVVLTSHTTLPQTLAAGPCAALFFCDDDDWFAPDLPAALASLDPAGIDVTVFPFIRLGSHSCTFLHPDAPPAARIEPCRAFAQRYHTNNYALMPRICRKPHLAPMQDHFDASAHGDAMGFADRQASVIVSATNKTPCAASFLRATVADPTAFHTSLSGCIAAMDAIILPAPLAWMRAPIDATIALFREALPA